MERKSKLPSKYNESRLRLVYYLALLGATDAQIAEAMEVDVNTIDLWKRTHPEFLEELSRGKLLADMRVAKGLFLNCQDRYVEEEEVHIVKGVTKKIKVKKFIQGDKWAQVRWLSIRQRGNWSDTQKVEITNTNINITKIDLTGFSTEHLKVMEEIGLAGLNQLPEHGG